MNFPHDTVRVYQLHGHVLDGADLREHIGKPDLPWSEADGDRPKAHRASH
jgi:hypothetical protein